MRFWFFFFFLGLAWNARINNGSNFVKHNLKYCKSSKTSLQTTQSMNIKNSLELISAGKRQQSLHCVLARQETVGEKLPAAAQGTICRSRLGKTCCNSNRPMWSKSSFSNGRYQHAIDRTSAQRLIWPLKYQSMLIMFLHGRWSFPRLPPSFSFVAMTKSLMDWGAGGLQVQQSFTLARCSL